MKNTWYVARTSVNMEETAKLHLGRQTYVSYVPKCTLMVIKRGEKRWVERPLFPNYIFVTFDVKEDRWKSINSTRGIVHLLPIGHEEPLPLPMGFVEELMALEVGGGFREGVIEDVLGKYLLGTQLRIQAGAMAGRIGKFVGRNRGCAVLLISLLGREIGVEVPAHQLESA